MLTTKDGDWGDSSPKDGYVPFYVIRGADFPAVRVGDVSSVPICYLNKNTVDRRTLQPDDIIIETAGGNRGRPTGRTLLLTHNILKQFDLPSTCASFSRFLRIDPEKADPKYVFWYLQYLYSRGEMWEYQVQHTGVARFQYTVFANTIEIPLPPLPTQHAIARILGSLDDKIELNRQMNETLEAMARAIFQSWFVDFDPVRAKAEGRDTVLPPEIAALFPDGFEEVNGREVPRGWRIKPLDQIATFLNGLALQKYPPNGEDYLPVIKIAQLHKGDTEGSDKASTQIPPEYKVNDGDILFSWSGSLEVVIWCGGKGALNQHLFKVSSEKYPKWFYYLWVLHHLSDFQLIAEGKATTMGHIQRHHLSDAMVVVPHDNQIIAMDKIFSPLLNKIVSTNVESRMLTQIRDALLPKLMSGEIKVGDVEGT